nr:cellulose synthase [Pandoraea pneumonica]
MATPKLRILDILQRQGISMKTGRPYDMRTAQCALTQTTSEGVKTVVGTVTLPEALKDTEPGDYLAEFAFAQSIDGQLVPRIVALQPYAPSARAGDPTKPAK